MSLRTTVAAVPTLLLAGLSGLHLAWARGHTVPYESARELSLNVTGQKEFPTPEATAIVAGGLAAGAGLAAGLGQRNWFGRLARRVLTGVFAARAVTGYRGTTLERLGTKGNRTFRENDRRVFAPLCAVIAASLLLTDPIWRRRSSETPR